MGAILNRWCCRIFILTFAVCLFPRLSLAAEGLDSGDTAWVIVSSALVLMMTLPGLLLFTHCCERSYAFIGGRFVDANTFPAIAVGRLEWGRPKPSGLGWKPMRNRPSTGNLGPFRGRSGHFLAKCQHRSKTAHSWRMKIAHSIHG